MQMRNWLAAVLNIQQDEGRLTVLLLLHSFCLGVSLVFFNTAAGAMFLATFNAAQLPWVYVGAAVVVTAVGTIYTKLEARLAVTPLLLANLAFLLFSLVFFRVSLILSSSKWLLMALFGWFEIMSVLTSLEFWGLAGRLLNVRQGKRLFGLIGSGEVAAGILTGASIPLLVKLLDVQNLLYCSMLGMAASFGMLAYITFIFSDRLTSESDDAAVDQEAVHTADTHAFAELLKNRYLLFIFALSGLSVFGYYFVDFAFYEQAENRYPDAQALASFLGLFTSVVGIINLLFRLFVTGRLLNRFGLIVGLMALPTMLALGGALSTISGSLATSSTIILGLFFWLVVATKLFDNVCRTAIDEPSVLILYQPLPAEQRLRTQTVIESIVEPIAGGLTGVTLILLTGLFPFKALHAMYILIGIMVVWLMVAISLRREYTVTLTRALAKRTLGGEHLRLHDRLSMAVIRRSLESPYAGEVIYALHMLEEIEHEHQENLLLDLLAHPADDVRLEVLPRLERQGTAAALPSLWRQLDMEISPLVQGAILRTLCILGESDVVSQVIPYLEHPDWQVRQGAIVGLIRGGGIEGVLAAGEDVNTLLKSSQAREREFAAQILGEVGIRNFFRPLLELLQDEDDGVRRAAIIAAGKLKNPRVWPAVLTHLSDPTVRSQVSSALIAGGEEALPELAAAFDAKGQSHRNRLRIVRICGRIRGPQVIRLLKDRLYFPDVEVRHQILISLSACGYRATGRESEVVRELLRQEGQTAAWLATARVDLGTEAVFELVRNALETEQERSRGRLFLLLSFVYNAQSILRARDHLNGSSLEKKAYALEVIDNLVDQESKGFLLPALEDMPETQRQQRLSAVFPQTFIGTERRLRDIISRPPEWMSSWTQSAAIYTVGQLACSEFLDPMTTALGSSSSLVRETAAWSMGRLRPDDLVQRLQPLTRDPVQEVREVSQFVIETVGMPDSLLTMHRPVRGDHAKQMLFADILLATQENPWRRCRAARYLGQQQSSTALTVLLQGMDIADQAVRSAVLTALHNSRFNLPETAQISLWRGLRAELQDSQHAAAALAGLLQWEDCQQLCNALEGDLDRNRARVLLLLTLLTSRQTCYDTLHYWYIQQTAETVSASVQAQLDGLLAHVAEETLQSRIAALLKHRSSEALIADWHMQMERSLQALHLALAGVACGPQRWLRTWTRLCALERMVYVCPAESIACFQQALQEPHAVIREMAVWALSTTDPQAWQQQVATMQNDKSQRVASLARRLA